MCYVAKIEMESNILEFSLRGGPRGFARFSCRMSKLLGHLFNILRLGHKRDCTFRSPPKTDMVAMIPGT